MTAPVAPAPPIRHRPAVTAIVLTGLTKRFGPATAVDAVSLSVARGEVVGLLGPNGAGKTTTLRMLAGFVRPTAGSASIRGHDVTDNAVAARENLGFLPEGAPAYDEMTPAGFLAFVAAARGLRGPARRVALDRAAAAGDLASVWRQTIGTLSKGQRRRVGLAAALLHDPPVLVLDEPTDGLDPNQKHDMRALIAAMAPDKAIVISTHLLDEVAATCTRAVVIARGRIVADTSPAALAALDPAGRMEGAFRRLTA